MSENNDRYGWMRIIRAVAGPAFLAPMALWAANVGRFVDVPVAVAAGCVVLCVAVLAAKAAGAAHGGHLVGAQLATLVFWRWSVVPFEWFGSVVADLIAATIAVLIVIAIGFRLKTFEWLPTVLGTAVGVAALSMAVTGLLGQPSSSVAASRPPALLSEAAIGDDILFLVLDGYTGPLILERDFDFDMSETIDLLGELGFEVPAAAWSNYTYTINSVPSLLELDYLTLVGDDLRLGADDRANRVVVAGDAGLMKWLADLGYRITKFESGWEDDRCGIVDQCFRASRTVGLTSWILLLRTPFRSVVSAKRLHPYPAAAISTLNELPDVLMEAGSNETPDFILAHVVSPHGPYALSGDCEVKDKGGVAATTGPRAHEAALAAERSGYADQVECLNRHLVGLAQLIASTEMTVLIAGDHGSATRGQLSRQQSDWSPEDLTERFGIFVATRTDAACRVTGASLVNVSREVVGCALGIDFPPLADRYYSSKPDSSGLVDVTDQMGAATSTLTRYLAP